jgi:hypothetical protein
VVFEADGVPSAYHSGLTEVVFEADGVPSVNHAGRLIKEIVGYPVRNFVKIREGKRTIIGMQRVIG